MNVVTALNRWMTDLKIVTSFGLKNISQVAIPGAHHAGLTTIVQHENLTAKMSSILVPNNQNS